MEIPNSNNGLTVRVYKGDAMSLLAFDLDESKTKNLTGFTVRITPGDRSPYFLTNLLRYSPDVLTKNNIQATDAWQSLFSPIQKYRWVHVPATFHQIDNVFYGNYKYEVTPRYMVNDILQPLDKNLTVAVEIDVSPYQSGDFKIAFTRGFVASQAYTNHFGNNGKVRPNKSDLIFDITKKSGSVAIKKNGVDVPRDYTFEEQYTWLGWQARARVLEFLDETLNDNTLRLDVFAFDLDEPVVCGILLQLAKEGRLRVILDNSATHTGKDSQGNVAFEDQFETLFKAQAADSTAIVRGKFQSLSHCKVFIQKKNATNAALKVLTGSTNFSTNGLYINANHVLIFDNPNVAELYAAVFEESFSPAGMANFKNTADATQDHVVNEAKIPNMTIRFSPHTAAVATQFFTVISERIKAATSDVLFAIMKDDSSSLILDAIKFVRDNDEDIFSYGITDTTSSITLYKPHTKKGVRVAGKKGAKILPPPFNQEAPIPGIEIHHKFVVVDFKTNNPVVYCGSSNLAFGPEQKNGDNLIEIHDKDAVTVFAIEAIRLVDHFSFRDREQTATDKNQQMFLQASDPAPWHSSYYDENDLHFTERTLLAGGTK